MRNRYNLSHLAHIAGHIGRLQTISVIPVVAGDSLEINMNGIMRLAPTRKEIVSECQIDICAFFVKHRHIYTDRSFGPTNPIDWVKVVGEGLQTQVPVLPAGPAVNADSRDPFFLGIRTCGATINKALLNGYNFIYQRYFAVPSTTGNGTWNFVDLDFYPNGTTSELINHRRYGARAARLPHILNGGTFLGGSAGGLNRGYFSTDWGVEIPQDTPVPGTALLDIRDLKAIQSRYSSIQEQNYFSAFYDDVIQQKWDTKGVNTDADPRPDYLGRATQFISGSDVNGTDDATLGSYVGKTLDRVGFRMPRRFFAEHGNVWIMMLPRFPMLHTKEQHPLLATAVPDNKLLLADPRVWSGEPVVAFDPGNWMAGGSAFIPDVGSIQQPYGQEYRYQPNRVHPHFETIPGYPFSSWDTINAREWYYYNDNEYADTFQTSQIGQWQAHLSVGVTKLSTVIDPRQSIFAGA